MRISRFVFDMPKRQITFSIYFVISFCHHPCYHRSVSYYANRLSLEASPHSKLSHLAGSAACSPHYAFLISIPHISWSLFCNFVYTSSLGLPRRETAQALSACRRTLVNRTCVVAGSNTAEKGYQSTRENKIQLSDQKTKYFVFLFSARIMSNRPACP